MRFLLLVSLFFLTACEDAQKRSPVLVDSESHWLLPCETVDDCHAPGEEGDLSCSCGVCTYACEGPEACAGLEGALCSPVGEPVCGEAERICTRPCEEAAECGALACVDQLCLPGVEVDASVPDAEVDRDAGADPDATPDAAPDATPDAAPDATPDAAPDATPDAAPDAATDATPDAAPDQGVPPRTIGEACDNDEQCLGRCVPLFDRGPTVCTQPCAELGCPEGWFCGRPEGGGAAECEPPETPGICVPLAGNAASCATDEDCPEGALCTLERGSCICVLPVPPVINECPTDGCCEDAECGRGACQGQALDARNAMCGGAPSEANECRVPQCTDDADCLPEQTCMRPGEQGYAIATCVPRTCRAHSDCVAREGGECTEFFTRCNVRGYHCTYADDPCRADDDCEGVDFLCEPAEGTTACVEQLPRP